MSTPSQKKRKVGNTLLAVWDEFWEEVLQQFGTEGVFWFRDSQEVTHWKSIQNPRAWEFVVLEWLFFMRGKGTCNANFKVPQWDFLGKPYIAQGSRFFRRDVRDSIRKESMTGIVKNVEKCPDKVWLRMKQICAFEQSFNIDTFEELGLLDFPPEGTDLVQEAKRRCEIIKSFYKEDMEWLTPEQAQALRRGLSDKPSSKPSTPKSTSLPPKKRSSISQSANVSDSESETAENAEKSDADSDHERKSRIIRNYSKKPDAKLTPQEKKIISMPSSIYVNIFSKSGKTISRMLEVPNTISFHQLLDSLPLPSEIPADEMYIAVSKGGEKFDNSSKVVDKVNDGSDLYIRLVKKPIITEEPESSLNSSAVNTSTTNSPSATTSSPPPVAQDTSGATDESTVQQDNTPPSDVDVKKEKMALES